MTESKARYGISGCQPWRRHDPPRAETVQIHPEPSLFFSRWVTPANGCAPNGCPGDMPLNSLGPSRL